MYLNRITIDNYAFPNTTFAFKNVGIKFERFFNPSIFPLGGMQGCGKSTLLKIIYQKIATDATHHEVSLDVSDLQKGQVHLVMQDEHDGLFPENATTFKDLLYSHPVEKQGSMAQQRKEALLQYIAGIKDSIILLDHPDLGLHPDQQCKLCRDIADLKTNNQFIVATHSYEFCEALTPSHVKILRNNNNEQTDTQ